MDERVPEVTDDAGDVSGSRTMELIRQSVRYAILAVLVTLAALWFLGTQRSLINYLVMSALLALALEPGVIWLHERRGWRRGSATGLLLAGVFVFLVLLAVGLAAVLAREANQVVDQLPMYVDKLNAFTRDHFDFTLFSTSQRTAAADATAHLYGYLRDHYRDIFGGVAAGVSAVFTIFTIGLFTFYLTAQGPQVRRALMSRMPPERQDRFLFAWETALQRMGGYLYSRLLLAAINGALMYVTLRILDVPYALPLAVVSAFIAEFIPIVGTYVGGVLPLIVALAENGPTAAIIVLVEIVVYQQVENYVLSPRISAKTIELNPGVAFGAAMAGGAVGGFVGAFFALPIAATIQAFLSTYGKSYDVGEEALERSEAHAKGPSEDREGRARRPSERDVGDPSGSDPPEGEAT
jgi:predicted PurR-regulated permease PerM